MKIKVFILVLLYSVNALFGQVTFEKNYGANLSDDKAYDGDQTSDGGFMVLGKLNYHIVDGDALLVRTNPLGDTLWTKTIAARGIPRMVMTADDGVVIMRWAQDSTSAYKLSLLRIGANGDSLWSKFYGIDIPGSRIRPTSDAGYIITGNIEDSVISLCKLDSNFNIQWKRDYGYCSYPRFWAWDVVQTSDNGYAISGKVTYYSDSPILMKTNASGDSLFVKVFRGLNVSGFCVREASDGGYIIGTDKGYLIKTNSAGDSLWCKNYVYNQSDLDNPFAIVVNTDGDYVVTGGCIEAPVFLAKIDQSGDTVWTRFFGGEVSGGRGGNSIIQTDDGGYFITGAGLIISGQDDHYDLYLLKVNENGILDVGRTSLFPENRNLRVFPNPSGGVFTVSVVEAADFEICNVAGEVVYSGSLLKGDNQFSLDEPDGVYFIKATNERNISVGKIFLQN